MDSMPEWARELIEDKTPYLASDPALRIVRVSDNRVAFHSRGYLYTANRERQQVI